MEIVCREYDQEILEDADDYGNVEWCEGVLAQIQILLPSCGVQELSAMTEMLWYCLVVAGVSVTMGQMHGPFGLCYDFRRWVEKKIQFGGPDNAVERANRIRQYEWILVGVKCPICWSFWVSLVAAVIWAPTLEWRVLLQYWLGGMGFVAVVMLLSPPSNE